MNENAPKYPGLPDVINGNGAVAHVMKHVCGGVIGYPITPSTEISETFEAARAEGQLNVWGKHPFFVETEGEHSAQSGALGAALTGGNYISNASSSQGILYGLESHYVTAGKKIGGFVLQVAARVVTKHSLNVMAGHDDIYALLPTGYTILFGSDPQEAADLAAISYRVSALSLIPVANAMDGFATSHVMSGIKLPEPELLREFLGDPSSWIDCPTLAQEVLFGAKGRVFQLQAYLDRYAPDFDAAALSALRDWLSAQAEDIEADDSGTLLPQTSIWVPADLQGSWSRAWLCAPAKGKRQLVPALVDPNNPGLSGAVQNQPDFQAGAADHRAHFASAVPGIIRQAMGEYAALTGRAYQPVMRYGDPDAELVVVGMGSITDDVRAILPYLKAQGLKAAVLSIKQLSPFPEDEFADLLGPAKALTILERSDDTALTRAVHQALFKAGRSAKDLQVTTAIFGLGSHDVQPRHLIAVYQGMEDAELAPVVYVGSQFFTKNPATPQVAELQEKLRGAYPETEAMALTTQPNPPGLLPPTALRLRFHSVGGYGTVATGKLLTDILSGMLGMNSKSSPKYGSEKSGAATNYYITLSPEPVLFTNAQLEDVEVVVSPDHQVFLHDRPLVGLVEGGTFILQSDKPPLEVWRSLPATARALIRQKKINFLVVDAFAVAKKHAPTPNLETRMMGIAFIGAIIGHVDRVERAAAGQDVIALVRKEIDYKFGSKGEAVVEANMAVITDGIEATHRLEYDSAEFTAIDNEQELAPARTAALSAAMVPAAGKAAPTALFDPAYFDDVVAAPFRRGEIGEAPAFPGTGLFMPSGSGALKNKGIFRRSVPVFDPSACTACLECGIACPDMAIPNQAHELHDLLAAAISSLRTGQAEVLQRLVPEWSAAIRREMLADKANANLALLARSTAKTLGADEATQRALERNLDAIVVALAAFPVARTRPLFDLAEKTAAGSGGLFSVVVDPWKCTGCLQCVAVCGPGALKSADQDDALLGELEARFERLGTLPNTPKRFTADALEPGGDTKRLLLDHDNYYALAGGHGACKGCGEVTATHLVSALSHASGEQRRRAHVAELEALLADVATKAVSVNDSARSARLQAAKAALEAALYRYEGGPTGRGTSSTVVVNSTGCSSVYASTVPFSPFVDPWVNSLFQDAQAVAVGVFEGLVANYVDEVKATRIARLELADSYDPAVHDKLLSTLSWRGFSAEELAVLPVVLTISGDGAAFDIGFGAMSRVLASRTPVKMMVLDTGGYSNTGGQASTASFTGQDSDLARHGKAHDGKQETRKELGLLAAFHPGVFVAASSTAVHGHFLQAAGRALAFDQGTALLQVYTPCGFEQGFADDAANARSRLAVESRMMPLFVHDPLAGATLSERFSLEGNPDPDQPWTQRTLSAVDEHGNAELVTTDLTPAEFAYGEVRFRKHFRPLAKDADGATPVSEYVQLAAADRAGKTPYILAVDDDLRIAKIAVSGAIVKLVEDRQAYWQTLRFLAGRDQAVVSQEYADKLAALQAEVAAARDSREQSLDEIAQAMAKLATAKDRSTVVMPSVASAAPAPVEASAAADLAATVPTGGKPAGAAIFLAEADMPKCTDCGTCYQELPMLFERTTILVDGAPKQVSQLKPGALDGFSPTPEQAATIERVIGTCDAEILQ